MAADAEVSLAVELKASLDAFIRGFSQDAPNAVTEGMTKAKNEVDKGVTSINDSLRHVGEGLTEGFAALASAAALMFLEKIREGIDQAAEYAKKLNVLHLETGDSVQGLQQLMYAFASVGVSADRAQMQFAIFQSKIEQAAALHNGRSMFERLGLDPKQMEAQTLSQNLDLVSDKIKNLSSSTERAAVARNLFGRSGVELLPMLTQGSAAIDKMKASAEGVISDETIEKLHRYHIELEKFSLVGRSFVAEFATPIVEGLTHVMQWVEKLMASFKDMPDSAKLLALFAALAAGVLGAENALAAFSPILRGLISKELIASFEAFIPVLNALIIIAGALFVAWQTNFGGVRELVTTVGAAIELAFERARQVLSDVGKTVQTYLAPAISNLSLAVYPVTKAFGDWIAQLVANQGTWNLLRDVLVTIVQGLSDLTNMLATAVNGFHDFAAAIIAIIAASAMPALVPLVAALKFELQWVALWMTTIATEAIPAFIGALTGGLIPAIKAFTEALWGAAAAEDIATLGLALVVQVIVGLLIFVVVKATQQMQEGVLTFDNVIAIVEYKIAEAIQAFADFINAMGDVIGRIAMLIPGLKDLADQYHAVGAAAQDAADKMRAAAFAKIATNKDTEDGKGPSETIPHIGHGRAYAPPDTGTKPDMPPGTEHIGDIPTKKKDQSHELAREDIDRLKAPLQELKDKVQDTELSIRALGVRLEQLGTINSIPKLAAAQAIYNSQIDATNHLHEQNTALLLKEQQVADALAARERAQHDPKIAREYHAAWKTVHDSIHQTQVKILEDEAKVIKLRIESAQKAADIYKSYTSDEDNSFSARLFYAQAELMLLQAQGAGLAEIHAQQRAILDIEARRADLTSKAKQFQYAQQISETDRATSVRAATPVNQRDVNAVIDKQTADAKDAVTKATIAETAAEEERDRIREQLAKVAEGDSSRRHDMENQLTAAENNLYIATTNRMVAEVKQQAVIDQTTPDVDMLRSKLVSLGEGLNSTIANIVKLIQTGVDPLQAIMVELASQSQSYHDVQVILTRIVTALAQVLDALRPVIDFLLGVLVGVVDVFLVLYNVVASILNVFGAHLEKIKLVNTALDNLAGTTAQAVPLLQIVHDLPTINEYNAGKWDDLIGKQNETSQNVSAGNDILSNGFNQSLSKFGEIIGILIAMRAILLIIEAHGVLSQAFGGGGGGGGIWGFIKGLFGGSGSGGDNSLSSGALGLGGPDIPASGLDTTLPTIIADDTGAAFGASNPLTITGDAAAAGPSIAGIGPDIPTSVLPGDPKLLTNATDATKASTVGLGQVVSGLGDLYSIYSGFKQGGISGGFQAGMGADALAILVGATGGVATPIAIAVGLAALIFGGAGKQLNAHDNPDLVGATQDYGQGMANLGGAGVGGNPAYTAGSSSYTEDPTLTSKIKGGEAAYISGWIKAHPDEAKKLLTPDELAEFTGVTTMRYDKNGMVDLGNGPETYWSTLVGNANDAVNKIFGNIQAKAMDLHDILAGATDIDLSKIFGNGSTITPTDGGYMLTPGGSMGGGSTVVNQIINFGDVIGTDPVALQRVIEPIMRGAQESLARQLIMQRRSEQFTTGNGEGAY